MVISTKKKNGSRTKTKTKFGNRKKSLKSRKISLKVGGSLKSFLKKKPQKTVGETMRFRPLPKNPHEIYIPQGPLKPYTEYGAPKPSKLSFFASRIGINRPAVNLYQREKKKTMNSRGLAEKHARYVMLYELGQKQSIQAKINALPKKMSSEEVQQAEKFNTIRLLTAKDRQRDPKSYETVPRVFANNLNAEKHIEVYKENAKKQRQSFADNVLRESFAEKASTHALQELGLSSLKDLNIKQTNMAKLLNKAKENSTTRGETIFNKDKALRNITAQRYNKYNAIREAYIAEKIAETPQSNRPKPITDIYAQTKTMIKIPEYSNKEEDYDINEAKQPLVKIEQASPPPVPIKSDALLKELAKEASAVKNQHRSSNTREFATLLPIPQSERENLLNEINKLKHTGSVNNTNEMIRLFNLLIRTNPDTGNASVSGA